MAACNWIRTPKLYMTYFAAFWKFHTSRISFCMFLVIGWLDLRTHPLLCPITCKLGASVHSIMSGNLSTLISYLDYNQPLGVDMLTCLLLIGHPWSAPVISHINGLFYLIFISFDVWGRKGFRYFHSVYGWEMIHIHMLDRLWMYRTLVMSSNQLEAACYQKYVGTLKP